ncbi:hypothetical protein RRF57_007556 [Xylaria bambusicola]|uniref:Uncharacterized protein n=1 Tax=Xylaria bambusicola TaxID=326684 RepID=A0AAN7UMY7_9PEZI
MLGLGRGCGGVLLYTVTGDGRLFLREAKVIALGVGCDLGETSLSGLATGFNLSPDMLVDDHDVECFRRDR